MTETCISRPCRDRSRTPKRLESPRRARARSARVSLTPFAPARGAEGSRRSPSTAGYPSLAALARIGPAERTPARLALSVCQKTRLLAARKSSIFAGRQGAVVGRIGHRPPGSSELRGPGSHGRSRNRFLADFQRARSVDAGNDVSTAERSGAARSEVAASNGRGLWWADAVTDAAATAGSGDFQ